MNPPINISIAEDHPLFRKGLKDFLKEFNIQVVIEACHGRELLEALSNAVVVPEVCLMDVNMPVMDGYEATAQLKKNWKNVKVLALSYHDHKYNITQMLKSGAVGYLFKNSDPKQIVEAIHSVVSHGYYYSEVLDEKVQSDLYNEAQSYKKINAKELQFLQLLCQELRHNDIAAIMNVSPRTIDGYRDSLFAKLNLKSKAGLILFSILTGIVDIHNDLERSDL